MILYSHPTGNAYVRQSLQALVEANMLAEFWTCINWEPDTPFARFLPGAVRQELARRSFPDLASAKAYSYPSRELGRLLLGRLKISKSLTRHETGALSVDAVFRSLDTRVAKRLSRVDGLKGVYCGEDGALETFRRAGELGVRRYYDLPIAYWRAGHAIFAEEREREPEWGGTLKGLRDSPAKLERKDEELRLADSIFVATSFTRNSLQLAPEVRGQVHLAPYGAPDTIQVATEKEVGEETASTNGPLRVLFVGSLGQRKGMSYLLKAVEPLGKNVALTLIGRRPGGVECEPLDRALKEYRWIPSLTHAEILAEMRRHDVFVFPSLFEGFGLVIVEALSQGLPVITTAHTAGPDLLTEGRDGFIVPIRSAEAITERLELLLNDRGLLKDMGAEARKTAQRCTWEFYREQQKKAFRSELQG